MSTTRLTFLYPHLFRPGRVGESIAATARARARTPRPQCHVARGFATSESKRRQSAQRHGKAVEPFINVGDDVGNSKVLSLGEKGRKAEKSTEKDTTVAKESSAAKETSASTEPPPSNTEPLSDEIQTATTLSGSTTADQLGSKTSAEATPPLQVEVKTSGPLDPLAAVLQMPPPETQDQENTTKPPHLQTPPYVHHFDTYTLVQQVEAGDFTTAQSITAMKAVRGLLALNLDVAKAELVSKSDVENVSFILLPQIATY